MPKLYFHFWLLLCDCWLFWAGEQDVGNYGGVLCLSLQVCGKNSFKLMIMLIIFNFPSNEIIFTFILLLSRQFLCQRENKVTYKIKKGNNFELWYHLVFLGHGGGVQLVLQTLFSLAQISIFEILSDTCCLRTWLYIFHVTEKLWSETYFRYQLNLYQILNCW